MKGKINMLKLSTIEIVEALCAAILFFVIKNLIRIYNPKWNIFVNLSEYLLNSIAAIGIFFKAILDIQIIPLISLTMFSWIFFKTIFEGAEKFVFKDEDINQWKKITAMVLIIALIVANMKI